MEYIELVWPLLLFVFLVACWVLTVVGLPGNWLIVAATAIYVFFLPGETRVAIGWPVVAVLAVLAALGELLEFVASAAGVAKRGGSRRGAVLAIVGSMIGGVVGIFVGLPIPFVGPILGALLFGGAGALAGAVLGETWKGRTADESWEIGKAAFWGRLLGTLGKVLVGCVMLVVAAAALVM